MQALTPTSASRPHSHPFIPVGNERPHDGTYGPTNLSTNWSGVIESGQGTTFTAIQGDWVVPGVGASTRMKTQGPGSASTVLMCSNLSRPGPRKTAGLTPPIHQGRTTPGSNCFPTSPESSATRRVPLL